MPYWLLHKSQSQTGPMGLFLCKLHASYTSWNISINSDLRSVFSLSGNSNITHIFAKPWKNVWILWEQFNQYHVFTTQNTLQVMALHSPIHTHVHRLVAVTTSSVAVINIRTLGNRRGFRIFLKDTLTCRLWGWGSNYHHSDDWNEWGLLRILYL